MQSVMALSLNFTAPVTAALKTAMVKPCMMLSVKSTPSRTAWASNVASLEPEPPICVELVETKVASIDGAIKKAVRHTGGGTTAIGTMVGAGSRAGSDTSMIPGFNAMTWLILNSERRLFVGAAVTGGMLGWGRGMEVGLIGAVGGAVTGGMLLWG